MAQTTDLATRARTPAVASGVVKLLDDISTLSHLPNTAGVLTSRALFSGTFTFQEVNGIATIKHQPSALFV